MAITFECEACGKSYTVGDGLAGKSGPCKQCGHRMTVPGGAPCDAYDLDGAEARSAPLPPRAGSPRKAKGARPPASFGLGPVVRYLVSLREPSRPGFFAFGKREAIRLAICLACVGALGYLVNERVKWARARTQAQAAMARLIASQPQPQVKPAAVRLPDFPEPGPARAIEPGVEFREIVLGPAEPPPTAPPGWGGKLWLYLPSGDHPPRSLPCVLIAPAGSNLVTGMELSDGDRAEHLPYVRAGFAVLAFELDGMMREAPPAGPAGPIPGFEKIRVSLIINRFLRARAGLVNAQVALEYLLAKVPQVDPARISSAGHSSAGTLSVLFAETEPRLRSCVAYAPVIDLKAALGPAAVRELSMSGSGELPTTYSPRNNESKLKCPSFLFVAKDDPLAGQVEDFARRLQGQARPVTIRTVPSGGHHDPMIQQGIPAAIDWLRRQDKGGG